MVDKRLLHLHKSANLCSKKHSATSEVIALVMMMVTRYYMEPGKSRWGDPWQDPSDVLLAINPPKSEACVQIVERKGLEGPGRTSRSV